jgi:hypothetical protein
MELYEKMDPIEREIMILEAVQGSISIEGMEKAAEECRQKIVALRKEQRKKPAASISQPKAETV